MTDLLFIRHGAHDLLGRTLTGRTHPVGLNKEGKRQAQWLASRITRYSVSALLCSPLPRCMETADPLSSMLGLPVEPTDALNEVEFGAWSGRDFSELAALPEWKAFNRIRSLTPPPGGENLAAVQARLLRLFDELRRRLPNGCAVLVSHADVIKAALAWLLGVPGDLFNRIEIDPGSLSHVILNAPDVAPRVLLVNETCPQ